tara:strand:+ start:159 stop:323 length:165 start_codon:yes stop_codon:yes gene_type:complete
MRSDRITEEADWRDGMNAFRSRCHQELYELKKEITILKQTINGRRDEGKSSKTT